MPRPGPVLLGLAGWLLFAGTALARPAQPTPTPTPVPARPSATPTAAPTVAPSLTPTRVPPTALPTPLPSSTPSLAPTPPAAVSSAGVLGAQVIGVSSEGRPLVVYQLGAGSRSVLIVGGIDGGTEANTTVLVEQLLQQALGEPDLVHGFVLLFLPAINPDGLATGTRMLANGVDANRNWPTGDWSPDTYVAGPTLIRGGGGPYPWSEPETRALAAYVQGTRPGLILSYHSAAALVMAGPAARAFGLDRVYADVTGYERGDWVAYPVTGDFAQWTEDQGIPTVEVELPDHSTTDFQANFTAFQALIGELRRSVYPDNQQLVNG